MKNTAFYHCFQSFAPAEYQKERIFYRIQEDKEKELYRTRSAIRRFSVMTASIVLFVVLASSALAVSFGLHEKLIEFFNITGKQESLIGIAADTPIASVTDQGITVEVKQTIADPYGLYILYEITGPDTMEFTDDVDMYPIVITDDLQNESKLGAGVFSNRILEQKGNRRIALYHITTNSEYSTGTIKMEFPFIEMIRKNSSGEMVSSEIIEGNWVLQWDFQYENTSKSIQFDQLLNDKHNILRKVIISPMAVYIFIEGDDITGSVRPTLHFTDGRTISFDVNDIDNTSFMYMLVDYEEQIYENNLVCQFDEMIDPNNIADITIFDETFPVQ